MLKQCLVYILSVAEDGKADAEAEAPYGNAWRLREDPGKFPGQAPIVETGLCEFPPKKILEIMEKIRKASQASQESQASGGSSGFAFQSLQMLLLRRRRITAA